MMKKKSKAKQINLRDRQEVLALMKILYGNDEVKDDQTHINTHREPGTKVASKVVEPSPTT
jgi:hypothetical protein